MAAALAVADRDGLDDALTMRRLADELGTAHTSLYRHVASRDERLVELVDHVLGEVTPHHPADSTGASSWSGSPASSAECCSPIARSCR
jgi:AcrR family transcriptional regulator